MLTRCCGFWFIRFGFMNRSLRYDGFTAPKSKLLDDESIHVKE